MIPLRKVTLLVGDPEKGKTFVALDLAARVTRGDVNGINRGGTGGVVYEWVRAKGLSDEQIAALPRPPGIYVSREQGGESRERAAEVRIEDGGSRIEKDDGTQNLPATLSPALCSLHSEPPGSALILSADDEIDDTLYPRLRLAGADMDKVYVLTTDGPRCWGQGRPQIGLADGVQAIDRAVNRIKDCRLVVIDPITAFMDGMSPSSHIQVRRMFTRLVSVAKRHRLAVLLISHNRKERAESAYHRAIGSLAFTATARVVFTLVEDPAVAERRLLLPVKMNLQRVGTGRAFRIVHNQLHWEREPVDLRPDDLRRLTLSGLATSDRLQDVIDWLRRTLAAGPQPSSEIHEKASRNAIPRLLLFKAKAAAGVRARFDKQRNCWMWEESRVRSGESRGEEAAGGREAED
jgi:hypothetical protein